MHAGRSVLTRPLPAALASLTLALALPFAFTLAAPASASTPRIVSRSPVFEARLVTPATGLTLRFAAPLAAADASGLTFDVVGSTSGAHGGRVALARDGRTVIFRPDSPFTRGETVRAHARLGDGVVPGADFVFAVAAREVPRPESPIAAELAGAGMTRTASAPGAMVNMDYPTVTTAVYGPTSAGQLFLNALSLVPPQGSYLMIVNDAGMATFAREVWDWTLDLKAQPDGSLTYYDYDGACFHVLDDAYATVRTIVAGNGYNADGHELLVRPDGNVLYMIYDAQVVDMSTVVAGGDTAAIVSGLVLQEQDTEGNIVFQWRSWDHFDITDASHEDLTAHYIDYVHGNAIEVDDDGNLLISSRHLDEITKIDHETGDVIWRLGGKRNQFTFVDDTLGFSHQHAIRRLANGHYTLFDNGNFHVPPFSRAVEYELDQVAHTARLVWQFRNTPDTFGFAMGNVQRLADGHTVIGWGTGTPAVSEVDSTGTKVMDLWLPPQVSSYRAHRDDRWPRAGVSEAPAPAPAALTLVGANPCRDAARFAVSIAKPVRATLEAFDVSGRRVAVRSLGEAHAAGRLDAALDVSTWRPGVYLCRLTAGAATETRRFVVVH